jgi:hypothetical protein
MRHNIGGCCDCGDEKTIMSSGFCKNHSGSSSGNIEQIPSQLATKVSMFIKATLTYSFALLKSFPDINFASIKSFFELAKLG